MNGNTVREQPDSGVTEGNAAVAAGTRGSSATQAPAGRIVIEPTRGWAPVHLGELWEYRELIFFMVWRDLKVRYRQTVLGILWVVVQPLILMLIFVLLLGKLGGLSNSTPGDVPYPVLVFAGLVPWTLFSSSLDRYLAAPLDDANLVTKVYFPRLILPISSVGSYLIDFVLATAVLLASWPFTACIPDWRIVALPALGVVALLSALGVGTWLTALNVRYRDVRYVVPFLVQIWLFASPVGLLGDPDPGRLPCGLQPESDGRDDRGIPLGADRDAVEARVATRHLAGGHGRVLISGAYFFRRVERTFADEIWMIR